MKCLERTQKVVLRIIYQHENISNQGTLELSQLPSNKDRYPKLLYEFAVKCVGNPKTENILPVSNRGRNKEIYSVPVARKQRL